MMGHIQTRCVKKFCLKVVIINKMLYVSIIIPVYNADQYIDKCLTAIASSSYTFYEIIVVDDGSIDNSVEMACNKGAIVLQMPCQTGPAAARNYGAKRAKGDILFFVDSDVLVNRDTIARVAYTLQKNPEIAAVFGSYDDSPAEKNFLSQYKNLSHHFVHQQSSDVAVTFWAGCGAIRQEIFKNTGGFDQNRYSKPSIEDIELGYRMKRMGYRILLDKDLQVKHLKQWRLGSLLRSDIFCRAIPWTKLILEIQGIVNDLNLRISHRISAVLVGLSVCILPFVFFRPKLLFIIFLFLTSIIVLNSSFYSFLIKRKGFRFAALAFPMQLLYFLYSGIAFVLCWSKKVFLERKVLC